MLGSFEASESALSQLRRQMLGVSSGIDSMRAEGRRTFEALEREAAGLEDTMQPAIDIAHSRKTPLLPTSPLDSATAAVLHPASATLGREPPLQLQQGRGSDLPPMVADALLHLERCKKMLAAAVDKLAQQRASTAHAPPLSPPEYDVLQAAITSIIKPPVLGSIPHDPPLALVEYMLDHLPQRAPDTIHAAYAAEAALRSLQAARRQALKRWKAARAALTAARTAATVVQDETEHTELDTSAHSGRSGRGGGTWTGVSPEQAAAKRRQVAEWRAAKDAQRRSQRTERQAAAAKRVAAQKHASAKEAASRRAAIEQFKAQKQAAAEAQARAVELRAAERAAAFAPPGVPAAAKARRAIAAAKAKAEQKKKVQIAARGLGLSVQGTHVGAAPPAAPVLGEIWAPKVPGGAMRRRVVPANPARLTAPTAAAAARQRRPATAAERAHLGRTGQPLHLQPGVSGRRSTALPAWRAKA